MASQLLEEESILLDELDEDDQKLIRVSPLQESSKPAAASQELLNNVTSLP